jgi:chromate reductase, NAD(P)H dehydrogenase (quinone)
VPSVQLLAISGSIRRDSGNTAVLAALRSRLERSGKATMTLVGLGSLPLFSVDLEGAHLPGDVRAFQEAVRRCDGLVICSPEYNYGMTGVLKNALDWASRPSLKSPLKGKPALIMSAATASTGGVRAIHQIRDTLVACLARVVARPDVVVAKVHEKIVDGKFIDETVLTFAEQAIDDLIAEIGIAPAAR